MKKLQKYTPFPYGTSLKYFNSPLHFLLKLSPKQKMKFKQKNKLFSLELGKSLHKRLLWQSSQKVNTGFSCLGTSWSVFTAAFFGKMWLLNNAAVVPGVVWPSKSKKIMLAKMKAFKALRLNFGNLKSSFLTKNLQKLYSTSFASQTAHSLWHMAGGLEFLKYNLFYKTGFYPSVSVSIQKNLSGEIKHNGLISGKAKSFFYPGDFNEMKTSFSFLQTLFSFGKKQSYSSMYANKPFLWLNSFYTFSLLNQSQKNKVFRKK